MSDTRTLATHTMVRGKHEWYCTARNPRCMFVTRDDAEMLSHVTRQQQDLSHLPPLPEQGPYFQDES